MTRVTMPLACLLLPALLAGGACRRRTVERYTESRTLMGTLVRITVEGDGADLAPAVSTAFEAMARAEAQLSKYRPESDVSRLNRDAGLESIAVSSDTVRVLTMGSRVSARSGGAFDITVGPIIRAWIAGAKRGAPPTDEEISSARALVGWDQVTVDAPARRAVLPAGFTVDLGGLAKGYIVDRACEALHRMGVQAGLVEAGGDLDAFGQKSAGGPWTVGVQDPRNPDAGGFVAVLAVKNRGVTTSGHYRRFSTIAGRRYSHIVDPRTGRPVENPVLSVTVVADSAAMADGYSTAVSVLGEKDGLALVEKLDGVECMLLVGDGKEGLRKVLSSGMGAYLRE